MQVLILLASFGVVTGIMLVDIRHIRTLNYTLRPRICHFMVGYDRGKTRNS